MKELMDLLVEKKVEVRVHKVYELEDAKQAHIVSFLGRAREGG